MNMKHGRVSEAKYLQVKLRVYNVCVYSIVLKCMVCFVVFLHNSVTYNTNYKYRSLSISNYSLGSCMLICNTPPLSLSLQVNLIETQ